MKRFASIVNKVILATVVLTLSTGCGGDTGDGYSGERGQVGGTITMDGKPLKEGCQVIFMAQKGGYVGGGTIQADGKYTVTYADDPGGLPVGIYEIQLTAPIEPPSTEGQDPTKMGQDIQMGPKGKTKGGGKDEPFPSKYASAATSMLKFDLKSGDNTADFELKKD